MPLRIEPFDPGPVHAHAHALARMWRASFEHGVGVKDPHTLDEQLAFLLTQVVPSKTVEVAWRGDTMVGFIAYDRESISQLYVRVENIGQGIGSALLARAQAASAGKLWLFAFQQNTRACAFYESRGFTAVARGVEPFWQLADVKYEWVRPAGAADADEGT